MYRLALFLMVLLGSAAYFATAADHHPPPVRDKVVYHIDSGDWQREFDGLRSLQNQIDAEGASHLDIKVMLYGDGLALLLTPGHQLQQRGIRLRPNADRQMRAQVDRLRHEGVVFLVCGSCAKRRGIKPLTDLYQVQPGDVVKNGVNALVQLEERGYTYIKP